MNGEQIKQEIGILKIFLSFSIIIFISIIAYIFQNYATTITSTIKTTIILITLYVVFIGMAIIFNNIKKLINKLGVSDE